MRTSSVETVLGALILLVALVFLLYSVHAGDAEKTEGYVINAEFNQVGGLAVGDAVRVSGVKIGTIKSIKSSRETYLAHVSANIDNDVKLPVDSAATVASTGLLGGNYLDISPGGDEKMLEHRGTIQYTQDAQNLEKLLGQFIFTIKDPKKEDAAPEAEGTVPADEAAGDMPPAAAMPAM